MEFLGPEAYVWLALVDIPNNSGFSQYEIIYSEEKQLNITSMVMVQSREFMVEGNSMNVVKTGNLNIMHVQRL